MRAFELSLLGRLCLSGHVKAIIKACLPHVMITICLPHHICCVWHVKAVSLHACHTQQCVSTTYSTALPLQTPDFIAHKRVSINKPSYWGLTQLLLAHT